MDAPHAIAAFTLAAGLATGGVLLGFHVGLFLQRR